MENKKDSDLLKYFELRKRDTKLEMRFVLILFLVIGIISLVVVLILGHYGFLVPKTCIPNAVLMP